VKARFVEVDVEVTGVAVVGVEEAGVVGDRVVGARVAVASADGAVNMVGGV
jgi:hypothetical protein